MSSGTFEDHLKSMYPNITPEEIARRKKEMESGAIGFLFLVFFFALLYWFVSPSSTDSTPDHEIKIVSLDFTAEPNNNNKNKSSTHYLPLVSARWDLLIRVPGELVGNDICLQGSLQASFLYKNVTLVTSSIHSYNELELGAPQILNVSAVATGEDLSGAIGKEIMEYSIKEKNEVQFGSRLSLTDCRKETKKGTVSYECEEAKLRFDHHLGSDQIKATAFGDHPTCIITE